MVNLEFLEVFLLTQELENDCPRLEMVQKSYPEGKKKENNNNDNRHSLITKRQKNTSDAEKKAALANIKSGYHRKQN